MLLCVFSNDTTTTTSNDNEEKMPVKEITNWSVFGKIPTTIVF